MNRVMYSHRLRQLSIATLITISVWQWSQAGIIKAKAQLAQYLIAHAWQQTLSSGQNNKPWPWADTWPIARITFKNQKTLYVLAGGKGNSLAFGPAHLSETALPGEQGGSVIGGHRDTHFALLEHSQNNDLIHIQNRQGEVKTYRIQDTWIVNSKSRPLYINKADNSLYLVTCYPFNAINPNGDMRFIVRADEEKSENQRI